MRFLGGVWRFLVGVKDALVLLFLLLFFLGVYGALSLRGPGVTVPEGSALVLDMSGTLVDQATERSPFAALAPAAPQVPEVQARDLIRAIDRARTDSRVKSIVLELDTFLGGGLANLQSVGSALQRFRAAGKPVYAYSTAYLDDGYFLASQANEVWLNPLGGVLLTGPGGSNLYFKNALDRLNINVNVFRVGTYKSAVEPFTRTAASPEAKAADQALVDSLWGTYVLGVRAGRPAADLPAWIASLPARIEAARGDQAKAALDARLIDKVGSEADFGRRIATLVGRGDESKPGFFNGIDHRDYLAATDTAQRGGAVGVVYVAGNIIDGEAPPGQAGGDTIAQKIAEAAADSSIKALVVRVDSPGGSVTASEKIRQALVEAKRSGKPVIASFGPVAASGGYWIATAADEIVAQPSTITGSIGVFAIIPTFERTLKNLGIGTDAVRSTPYSGQPDLLTGISPDTRVILQAGVADMYGRFLTLVSTARRLPVQRVDAIAQGRVWAGSQALQLGLVDRIGGLDVAVERARARAKLPADARTVDVEAQPPLALRLLSRMFRPSQDQGASARDPFAKLAATGQLRLAGAVGEAMAVAQGPTMQAHCLGCLAYAPPRAAAVAQPMTLLGAAREVIAR